MSLPSPGTLGAPALKCFTNCQLCISGESVQQDIYFSPETGLITPNYYYRTEGVDRIDLHGLTVAPGFLDLQTNGMLGIHFTQLGDDEKEDGQKLAEVARRQVQSGVTAWWATVPTVAKEKWRQILPSLIPRSFSHGASLLGAHVEGPYLQPTKKGAHSSDYFQKPTTTSPTSLYGESNITPTGSVKLITLAPELEGTTALIGSLLESNPQLRISLGHSAATYDDGLIAIDAGATALTHVFNAMAPLHQRNPGLAGLITARGRVYFSIITDGIHLHPATVALAFRADPLRCIVITDAVELAGLADGVYPGHGQIAHRQLKRRNKVTIEGTDTLVGSCCMLDECVRNLIEMTDCALPEAVRCVTENVATMMGENKRGVLEFGRRADFTILDAKGTVIETWIAGVKVWERSKR